MSIYWGDNDQAIVKTLTHAHAMRESMNGVGGWGGKGEDHNKYVGYNNSGYGNIRYIEIKYCTLNIVAWISQNTSLSPFDQRTI